jgi:hypothetical protein
VPKAARNRIVALRAANLSDRDQEILQRLATDPSMRTDVWNKLPDQPPNMEGQIIDLVFVAVRTFWQVVPHPPYGPQSTRSAWKKYATVTHGHPRLTSPESVIWTMTRLLQALIDHNVRARWDELWNGDPSITFDKCVDFIVALGLVFDRLDQENKAAIPALPAIKRPYGKQAPEVFFSQLISSRLASIYGKPLDGVVAALTSVAFDLPNSIAEETIRSRRR